MNRAPGALCRIQRDLQPTARPPFVSAITMKLGLGARMPFDSLGFLPKRFDICGWKLKIVSPKADELLLLVEYATWPESGLRQVTPNRDWGYSKPI